MFVFRYGAGGPDEGLLACGARLADVHWGHLDLVLVHFGVGLSGVVGEHLDAGVVSALHGALLLLLEDIPVEQSFPPVARPGVRNRLAVGLSAENVLFNLSVVAVLLPIVVLHGLCSFSLG